MGYLSEELERVVAVLIMENLLWRHSATEKESSKKSKVFHKIIL